MSRLSLLDSIFFLLERRETPMHVGSVQLFRMPPDAGPEYTRHLLERLQSETRVREPFAHVLHPPYPRFNLPRWEPDRHFDLSWHVRHLALPPPGDLQQLAILVGHLHSGLLDRHRPLWSCHLIDGIEGGRFALYLKAHHACIDGVGGMKALQSMLSATPDRGAIRAPWIPDADAAPGPKTRAREHSLLDTLGEVLAAQARTIPQLAMALAQLAAEVSDPRKRRSLLPYGAPRSVLNRPLSADRKFAMQSIPLEGVRRVGELAGATVNDVVLAVCAGALRAYLQEKKKLPRAPLIAFVPMALKAGSAGGGHNQICNLQCDLGTGVRHPVARLQRIRASIQMSKKQLEGMSPAAMQNYSILMGAPFLLSELLHIAPRLRPPFNVVISNVPGPRDTLYLDGSELEALYPVSVLPDSQALNMTFFSYRDQVRFGLLACWKVLPDLERLAELLGDSWRELEAATLEHYS